MYFGISEHTKVLIYCLILLRNSAGILLTSFSKRKVLYLEEAKFLLEGKNKSRRIQVHSNKMCTCFMKQHPEESKAQPSLEQK